jgi:hypothetical protein
MPVETSLSGEIKAPRVDALLSLTRNPQETCMNKLPPGIRIVHNRLLGGWFIVRGRHDTPIGGRYESRAAALAWLQTSPRFR